MLTKQPSDQPELGKFDLGPTWFWPQYEPIITNLVETFGLKTILQPTEGAVLVEQSPNGPVQRGLLPEEAVQQSVRLTGGMQALVDAIATTLPPGTVELNTHVTAIHKNEEGKVTLGIRTNGKESTIQAGAVILALPPHIIAHHIDFSPLLSDKLMTSLRDTPTWMAEQAKEIAIYDRPFWRDEGLSGQAMSWSGGP